MYDKCKLFANIEIMPWAHVVFFHFENIDGNYGEFVGLDRGHCLWTHWKLQCDKYA